MSGLSKFLGNAAKVVGTDIYSNMVNAGGSMLGGFVNEFFTDRARKKNYEMNEKAAKAADKRQREQYQDLYSPQAMLEQYRAAGLSPSLMMSGGAPAVGGTASGNMSSGSSGGYPTPSGGQSNPLIGAQIENIMADTEGKKLDNSLKEIQKNLQEIQQTKAQQEWHLLSNYFYDEKGKHSIADYARNFKNFGEFKEHIMKQKLDDYTRNIMLSENGEQILRSIYHAVHSLDNDIAILSSSKMNAMVMEKVSRALYNSDFAENKKDALLKQLKDIAESSELTATQKGAFNNLIEKLGNGTFKDIVIVLLMALSNFQRSNMTLDFGAKSIMSNHTYNQGTNAETVYF